MKMLDVSIFGIALTISTACFGQIDIFQSDAYSVEEMCAREAEQDQADYTGAYDSCIDKNRDNPMYQSVETDDLSLGSDENNLDGIEQAETVYQDDGYQDFSQNQIRY